MSDICCNNLRCIHNTGFNPRWDNSAICDQETIHLTKINAPCWDYAKFICVNFEEKDIAEEKVAP
jgi:hypothetical protein